MNSPSRIVEEGKEGFLVDTFIDCKVNISVKDKMVLSGSKFWVSRTVRT